MMRRDFQLLTRVISNIRTCSEYSSPERQAFILDMVVGMSNEFRRQYHNYNKQEFLSGCGFPTEPATSNNIVYGQEEINQCL